MDLIFFRHRLPPKVLNENGAVLLLTVWDRDRYSLNDDFVGECMISLPTISSVKSYASLRDVPVTEEPLRRLSKNNQPQVFEVNRIASRRSTDLIVSFSAVEKSRTLRY